MPMQLIDLVDADQLARAQKPAEDAFTLPPRAYTEPEVFELERERIFGHEWICVAHTSQLPNPGDYRCVDLIDYPIVITHARDGEFHALSRICLHRAMPIAEGSGNSSTLTCPYHLWSYSLDGTLRGAPHMDGVNQFNDPPECLPRLRVELWNGFVFVNRDDNAPALSERWGGLAEALGHIPFESMQVVGSLEFDGNWNWKLLVENFMEAYHHIGPHRETEWTHSDRGSWRRD